MISYSDLIICYIDVIILVCLLIHVIMLINDDFEELIAYGLRLIHGNACREMRGHDGNAIMLHLIKYVQSM